eukprot:jgi/Mesvir1/16912/Mv25574-RA.1
MIARVWLDRLLILVIIRVLLLCTFQVLPWFPWSPPPVRSILSS